MANFFLFMVAANHCKGRTLIGNRWTLAQATPVHHLQVILVCGLVSNCCATWTVFFRNWFLLQLFCSHEWIVFAIDSGWIWFWKCVCHAKLANNVFQRNRFNDQFFGSQKQNGTLKMTKKTNRSSLVLPFKGYIFTYCAGIGVTCGAHRLWSHRGYKATVPLRTMMMLLHTCAGQNDLYTWVRDHRVSKIIHFESIFITIFWI